MTILYQLFETSLFVVEHYALLGLFILPAWALGRRLLRRVPFPGELEANVVAVPIGFASLATGLMCLALLHLFRPAWVLVLVVASQVFAWTSWRDAPAELRRWWSREVDGRTTLVVVGLALLAAPLIVLPLYPPNGFDEVMFHLPFARAIVESQGMEFFRDLRYPVFPALMEIQYAVALMVGNDLLPAQLHFTYLILVALLIYAWAQRDGRPRVGLWAALLWLGTPVAVYTGIAGYVDCGLAFFATAMLYSLIQHHRSRRAAWLLLAGACAGFSVGVKYHGFFFLGILLAWLIFAAVRDRHWRAPVAAGALALLPALPFYGYIVGNTGNPIFPFAPDVFGISQWAFELRDAPFPIEADDDLHLTEEEIRTMLPRFRERSLGFKARSIPALARKSRQLFTSPAPFGGRPISPFFLLLLPFAGAMVFLSIETAGLLVVFAIFFAAWNTTGRDSRYLLVMLPILALASSQGLDRFLGWLSRFSRPGGRIAGMLVTAVLMATAAAIPAEIAWINRDLPVNEKTREVFLTRRFPIYPAIRFINQEFGAVRTYGLFAENLRFYARGELLGDWLGPQRFRHAIVLRNNLPRLATWLRSLDVEYLLIPDPEKWRTDRIVQYPLPEPALLPSRFELVYQDEISSVYRLRTSEEKAGDEPGSKQGPG